MDGTGIGLILLTRIEKVSSKVETTFGSTQKLNHVSGKDQDSRGLFICHGQSPPSKDF
jgi:hypothetical protein